MSRLMVQQRGGESPAARPPSAAALRLSTAIRISVAILTAGALTALVITAWWGPLTAKSDVIGYPIFADFNPNNYAHAYYLIVGLFPIGALLIFLALTRLGPRIGLATPPARGRLWPPARAAEEPLLVPELAAPLSLHLGAGARVAAVGAVLGLEVGVASDHLWRGLVPVMLAYAVLVALISMFVGRLGPWRSSWDAALSRVNALGAPLAVAGLSIVSAQTGVRVLADNSMHHYTWFPVWLGVPLAAALLAWILVALRRTDPGRALVIERRAVLGIAGGVAMFLLVAVLPGDLGTLDLYEEGQFVTEARLVLHGWVPWRDVLVVHGVLRDVLPTAVGWGMFGNTYWGSVAGTALIFFPLTIVGTYWLLAYLVGRSWPVLLIGMSIFLGTWLGAADTRFLLWPLILLLLAAALKDPTRRRAAALGVALVVQALVTPEMLGAVPIVAVVIAAYELYWRVPGTPWRQAFSRTVALIIAAVLTAAVFVIYMASRGALGDVISVTRDTLSSKFNQGIPPNPGFSQHTYDVIAGAPVAALLISFAYAVIQLRLRRPFRHADWVMGAAALYVLAYYTKFLTFMDLPHAYEPFMMATPLMIYIIYRAVTGAERWIRAQVPERGARWLPGHPIAIVLLIAFAIAFWGSVHSTVSNVLSRYRPTAPDPPIARIGYAVQYDRTAVDDLRQIINAYLGPHDRLLDMTNEPALFFYFLGRDPSTRWFAPVTVLSTAKLQSRLLDDLRRTPPKLIVMDDTDTKMWGLPNISGVSAPAYLYLVSRWVLSHYRPLADSHGRMIYARTDLPPLSSVHLALHQQPATTGVPFLGQACNWGDAPTFLSGPGEPGSGAQPIAAPSAIARAGQVTYRGWAGDVRDREPAREVIATFDGKVVGRATPNGVRPDVPAAGYPRGFLHAGFQLSIPTWANASSHLRVFAIGRDGSVADLALVDRPAQGGVTTISGRTVTLQPKAVTGHVEALVGASGPLTRVQPPAGSSWGDYRWLEVDAPSSGFLPGGFTVSDQPAPTASGHTIEFATVANSPRRYIIPVSSCPQWRGYGSGWLYVSATTPQQVGHVSLIR